MKQKYTLRTFLFLILYQALYACTSMEKIPIQVAVPPKYNISPEIKSIAVLNRSMNADFTDFRKDSAENLLENLKYRDTFLDSTASDSALIEAAKALFNSQRFDVVVPLDRNIWRNDHKTDALPPLDTAFINKTCNDFKVDAVLVLESFSEKINGNFSLPWRRVIGQLDLTYNSSWNLYQPGQSDPLLSLSSHDILSWVGGLDNSNKEGVSQLPSIKSVLVTGGIVSGLDIAGQISTNWNDETRFYYVTGDKKIDKAIPLIKMNKWDEASEIWMRYLSVPSKKLQSKIEYNLALAAEMSGDLDKAIEWSVKSSRTMYSRPAEQYAKYLEFRRAALEKSKK